MTQQLHLLRHPHRHHQLAHLPVALGHTPTVSGLLGLPVQVELRLALVL
jgi:hypothetical protein